MKNLVHFIVEEPLLLGICIIALIIIILLVIAIIYLLKSILKEEMKKDDDILLKHKIINETNEEEYPITKNITILGRDENESDIVIHDDGYIGRKHMLIYMKNNLFFIVDLGSKNGILLNGEKIEGEKSIKIGDEINLGMTKLIFGEK